MSKQRFTFPHNAPVRHHVVAPQRHERPDAARSEPEHPRRAGALEQPLEQQAVAQLVHDELLRAAREGQDTNLEQRDDRGLGGAHGVEHAVALGQGGALPGRLDAL